MTGGATARLEPRVRKSARRRLKTTETGYAVTPAVFVSGEIVMKQNAPDLYRLARGEIPIDEVLRSLRGRPVAFRNPREVRLFKTDLRGRAARGKKHQGEESKY